MYNDEATDPKQQKDLIGKLKYYRDKLLKIDWRNRSVILRQIYNKWCFDLGRLESRSPSTIERIIERALASKKSICLIADPDIKEDTAKDRAKLVTLSRNVHQIEMETGLKETFLGFPFLVGHITAEYYVRAPLVLFPVQLEHLKDIKPAGWYLIFPKDEMPVLNRALLAAIRKIGGYSLPDSFTDDFEDLLERVSNVDKDSIESVFLNGINELLIKNDFPLEAIENKLDKLEVLDAISRDDERQMTRQPLHLVNYKIIGNFPQGSSAIFADYEELISRANAGETNQGIIDNLLEAPADPSKPWDEGVEGSESELIDLDMISDKDLNFVIQSDASQDGVVVAAQSSECVVVRGPPGTGKSQVIVNLISNALAKQQTILLMCQKRAALDVVFQRLDKVGLGKHVVLLHHANTDRPRMYSQLSNLVERGIATEDPNVHQILADVSNEIDELTEKQVNLTRALWKPYFGGIRIQQLYTLARQGYVPVLNLDNYASRMDYSSLRHFIAIIPNVEDGYRRFDDPSHPWADRKDFSSLGHADRIKLDELLNSARNLTLANIVAVPDEATQLTLIDALRILASETGMFRKMKPKWKTAQATARRLLGVSEVPNDRNYINSLIAKAENGEKLWSAINKLRPFQTEAGHKALGSLIVKPAQLGQRLLDMKNALTDFDAIQAHDARKASLTPIQREILEQCKNKLLSSTESWADIVREEFFANWIDIIERENPVLRGQPFETYLQQRKRLAKLLKEKRELLVKKLIHDLGSRVQRPTQSYGRRRTRTEEEIDWNKLAHELGKKRRVKPVRKLLEEFESKVFKIAPCWLASPEVVSEVFPLERKLFDLVIVDEASQCAVERALPALYRSARIVIAGDEKQLRPFDLFQIKEREDEEDETVDESLLSESLLILAKRIYGFRYLNWHYRSKYQELIDFSNHAFYDGHLQVAPSVLRKPKVPPIRWITCNGVWENRQNLIEASRVVDEVKSILLEDKLKGQTRSIGIITFNDAQQTAILDEIDRRLNADQEFDELYSIAENPISKNLDDRPFVKNIENVQGDERDVIIFSVGYARDPDGQFRLQFGSLSQEGGENRLNVAVTRAREEIVIVCSINPEELRTETVKNSGPRRLQDYLRYAKATSEANKISIEQIIATLNPNFTRETSNGKNDVYFESSFEEIVHKKLEQLGYKVDAQVGYSGYRIDLAVVHPDDPERYILAIECDGATFHSAQSTRERDVMRQEFLEGRGWVVDRIWSRNWWRDSGRELTRIKNRIEELRQQELTTISKE